RYIRANKAARIIGCGPGMQTGWIKYGRIHPVRHRIKPCQASPCGWVTAWPLGQAIACGLTYGKQSRHWTEAEEDQLLELLGTVPIAQIAATLARTVEAVRIRARELGISETTAQGLM